MKSDFRNVFKQSFSSFGNVLLGSARGFESLMAGVGDISRILDGSKDTGGETTDFISEESESNLVVATCWQEGCGREGQARC